MILVFNIRVIIWILLKISNVVIVFVNVLMVIERRYKFSGNNDLNMRRISRNILVIDIKLMVEILFLVC